VQEQALRWTSGLKGTTYAERCAEVGLETLEARRNVQDMMQVFKIIKGVDKVNPDQLFAKITHGAGTRNTTDPWNLQRGKAKKEVRLHSFGLRTIERWNKLSVETKQQKSTGSFKRALRRELLTGTVEGT